VLRRRSTPAAPGHEILAPESDPPMPYSQDLADRIESRLGRRKGATQKKMFGGVGFLIHGNMCCGVYQDWLIINYYRQSR